MRDQRQTHRSAIATKLGVRSAVEIARLAQELGVIDPDAGSLNGRQ